MPCCARIPVIHRCISSRSDASGLSVSASITAPWPWNTRAIWSGSGSAGMPTTTGYSGRRRPSPGMHGFSHTSQGVGSTKERSTYGQQARVVWRSHLYPCRTRMRPPLVKRQTTPLSGFFVFFPPLDSWRCQQTVSCPDLLAVCGCQPRWLHHTRMEVPSSRA